MKKTVGITTKEEDYYLMKLQAVDRNLGNINNNLLMLNKINMVENCQSSDNGSNYNSNRSDYNPSLMINNNHVMMSLDQYTIKSN